MRTHNRRRSSLIEKKRRLTKRRRKTPATNARLNRTRMTSRSRVRTSCPQPLGCARLYGGLPPSPTAIMIALPCRPDYHALADSARWESLEKTQRLASELWRFPPRVSLLPDPFSSAGFCMPFRPAGPDGSNRSHAPRPGTGGGAAV